MTHFDPKALKRALMVAKSISSTVGESVGKAYGGEIDDETQTPASPVFRRMAQRTSAGMQPTNIVKEKGGNWISGTTKTIIDPLLPKGPREEDRAWFEQRAAEHPEEYQTGIEAIPRTEAIHNWLTTKLDKYLRNEMGTKDDPLIKQADEWHVKKKDLLAKKDSQIAKAIERMQQTQRERGVTPEMLTQSQADIRKLQKERDYIDAQVGLHVDIPYDEWAQDMGKKHREYFGMPTEPNAVSPIGRAWEAESDRAINRPSSYLDQIPFKEYSGGLNQKELLEKLGGKYAVENPEAIAYSFNRGAVPSDLGFDHLIDELKNSINPDSGLPPHLLRSPEDLRKMNVPQAVKLVDEINAWRSVRKGEANAARAGNIATHAVKEYPESGMKWVELKGGDTPESQEALKDALKYEGEMMSHCVGGYCDPVISGESRIFSLRDSHGKPHATIEVGPGDVASAFNELPSQERQALTQKVKDKHFGGAMPGTSNEDKFFDLVHKAYLDQYGEPAPFIKQIKGPNNRKPDPAVIPMIQDFVKSGDWKDVGDFANTDLLDLSHSHNYMNFFHPDKKEKWDRVKEHYVNAKKIPPRYVSKEEFENPDLLVPKPDIAKAAGGIVTDPQKAIRRALIVARKQRKLGGANDKDPNQAPPSAYFEVAPGKTWDPAMQESWEQLHPQAKQTISNRMIEEFVPKWQKKNGIRGEVAHGLGGYGGFTNPNFTFRPHNSEDIASSLNGLGELFRQDAMMGAHHEPFEGSFPSGLVRIHLPKNVSDEKIHEIYKTLNDAGLAEGHSTDLEKRFMDILSGSSEDEAHEAAKKMDNLLGGRYNLHTYQTNVSFPSHGEHYGRHQTSTTERPNAPSQDANDTLQAEASERLKGLIEEAHRQGGGHSSPVDFSSLESLSRIYGGRIAIPSIHSVQGERAEGTLGVANAPGVSFRGKQPHEFTPAEWGQFGEEHGVPNLGPKDTQKWNANLQKLRTLSGREITVPGGIDSTEPFSYYDLLHMKSQGIDPNDLHPETHQKIHDRMIASMQPSGTPSPIQIANQMMFGMISPNQPLTPNELALQRIMAKGHGDIAALASMVPYHYSEGTPSRDQLQHFSRAISRQLGLHAGHQGGIGASGSANYADIAEFAQKMKDRPDFFTFNPTTTPGNSPSEKWSNHVARVINEVRGLSAKTGSLASVWQSPRDAAISAIDRHMATRFQNNVFDNELEQAAWQKSVLQAFNAKRKKADRVKSFDEMLDAQGGRGHFVDAILAHVNNIPSAKTRIKKTGEYNPSIPQGLRDVNWVSKEPEQMSMIAGPYVRALEQNAREAEAAGQGLFSNQWMLWDRIRHRLEPHEILMPGLEKLPRMSLEQMKRVRDDLSKSGYLAESGTVKPLPSASHAGYFAKGGTAKEPKQSAVDRALHLAAHLRKR